MAQTEEKLQTDLHAAEELKAHKDVDLLAIISERVADIENDGYPTETVVMPTNEVYVNVHKINKLRAELQKNDLASLQYDEATQVKAEKIKAEIELLQEDTKKRSYTFVLRGFGSVTYQELQKTVEAKEKVLKEDETLDEKDTYLIQLLTASIDSYTLNNEFVDFKAKTNDEKLKFVLGLDKLKQIPFLVSTTSTLMKTSNDFEQAMSDLNF